MSDEKSFLAQERCQLIARRFAPFAIGWLGTMAIWLAVFAAEGRLTVAAAGIVGAQALILGAVLALCRSAPAAPRVVPVVVGTSVVLGVTTTALVHAVGANGEILAFLLLTLYLSGALIFSWGWRAELALLVATLGPWGLVLGRFAYFVAPLELAAAVVTGAALALAIAEGSARNARAVWRRRRAQEQVTTELQISRDAYRDLAQNARDMIWACDLAARFTYANEALARFVGVASSHLLGRSTGEFFTAHPRNPDPQNNIARAVAGETLPLELIEVATPAGLRWIEAVSWSVRDGNGVLIGMQGISRDVTERHLAEEALRASEARYRGLVESQLELIVRMDPQGRFTFVNDAYAAKFGKPQGALLGQLFLDLVHPDDRDRIAVVMAAMAHPPHRAVIEIRNLTVEGVRWIAWEGAIVVDGSGAMVEAQAVGRDVTERRASEDALRASEARYRGLVESARELVTRFDRDGNLTFANDAYCQALGYSRESIVGRNPLFLVHPDDREAVIASFRTAMAPPYRGRRESRGLTPGGWRWFDWELSGVRDDQDRVVEVQQVGRDVTARHQAEADLRESEERFRSAFEDAAVGMGITTMAGIVVRANRAFCQMTCYAEHELLGRALYDLVHPDDHDRLRQDQKQLADGTIPMYLADRRYVRADGEVIWVVATASVVRGPDGRALYVIGQLQDVTERRLAEDALRASVQDLRRSEEKLRLLAQRQAAIREEERKRLGFDLHDDVCQELVGVGILVESLRRKLAPMPVEHAAEFERVVGYLGEVIEHLRLLARELRPLLLRDLGLGDGLRSLADGLSSARLRVVTELGAPIPRLEEETEVSVYRIAQEALANAVRHANASRVVVTLAARDGILHLEVADDGRGFDPAARPAVALGLASMEERALALGGRLEIRSAPGAGTTVTLACPLDLRVPGRFKELAAPSPTRSSSPPSTTTIPRAAARD